MTKDRELEKIKGIMNRLNDLETFFYSGGFNLSELKRIKRYISSRYKYFFNWIKEDDEE